MAITAVGLALGPLILPVGVVVGVIGGRYWLEAAIARPTPAAIDRESRSE